MLSRTGEYALRAVAFLAGRQGVAWTVQQIAPETRVPRGYLAKVLQQLVRAGLVRSQRGVGGGFVLARPAASISVLEVLNAVDPIRRIRRCPLDLPEHRGTLCALHRRLDDAYATIEESFARTRLSDLVGAPARRGAPPAWPRGLVRAAPRRGRRA